MPTVALRFLVPALVALPAWATDVTASASGGDITTWITTTDTDGTAFNVTLSGGDYSITLPAGTTTYTGVVSGTGTLTINPPAGSSPASGTGDLATLAITKTWTMRVPDAQLVQSAYQIAVSGRPVAIKNDLYNPPVATISPGVTLSLGSGTSADNTPNIYSAVAADGRDDAKGVVNFDNLVNNGRILINHTNGTIVLGSISGTGPIVQTGSDNGAWKLYGPYTSSGTVHYQGGGDYGSNLRATTAPNLRAIINEGSFIVFGTAIPAPAGTTVITPDIYEPHFGDDVNTHHGTIIFNGIYSYTDNSPYGTPNLVNPGLSDPDLNYQFVWNWGNSTFINQGTYTNEQLAVHLNAHRSSFRGCNIEAKGQRIQWGDGTHARFFLPATPDNSYINLHGGSTFAICYSGAVELNTPIAGGPYGGFNDRSMSAIGVGNVIIAAAASGHAANVVTFAQPMYYNGTTTIDAGATLVLGRGSPWTTKRVDVSLSNSGVISKSYQTWSVYSGDSSLLTPVSTSKVDGTTVGASTNAIVNNGTLTVNNTETAITLMNLSGNGGLVQRSVANNAARTGTPDAYTYNNDVRQLYSILVGAVRSDDGSTWRMIANQPVLPTLTLSTNTPYTGPTTIEHSTLAIASGGSIATSSSVTLSGNDAVFDISQAGNQTIQGFAGTAGTVALGSAALTLGTAAHSTFAGTFTDGGIGGGTGGAIVKQGSGTLTLTGSNSHTGGSTITAGTVVAGTPTALGTGAIVNQATLALATGVHQINAASFRQTSTGTVGLAITDTTADRIAVSGTASLGGTLVVTVNGTLTAGAVHTLVSAASVSGAFNAITVTNTANLPVVISTTATSVIATVQTSAASGLAAPTSLAATSGADQIAVTWGAISGATSYTVKRATVSGGPYTDLATGLTNTAYTDAAVTSGQRFYYVVVAVGSSSTSGNSPEVSAIPLVAPATLTATASDGSVSLTWNTVAAADAYSVQRATSASGPWSTIASNLTATTFTDTGLSNGTTYVYTVAAVAGAASQTSPAVSATPSAATSGDSGGGSNGCGFGGILSLIGLGLLGTLRLRRTRD
jgi:autotransporter-associated beta strand protein